MNIDTLSEDISAAMEAGHSHSTVISAITGNDPVVMIDAVHALRSFGADGDPWVDEICDEMDEHIRRA